MFGVTAPFWGLCLFGFFGVGPWGVVVCVWPRVAAVYKFDSFCVLCCCKVLECFFRNVGVFGNTCPSGWLKLLARSIGGYERCAAGGRHGGAC